MRSGNNHQEEEEDEDEEFDAKKDATPSTSMTHTKDGNTDKANAIRSKHSVTEQRRRSKINERYQILRGLIPNSDQKRDTASFLLEVIHYVQYLQEKVQKYEGPYQTWSSEPAKLMPWRNSQWQVPGFVGHSEALKNVSGLDSTFCGRFDENIAEGTQHNPVEEEVRCGSMEPVSENANNAMRLQEVRCGSMEPVSENANNAMRLQAASIPVPIINDFPHMLHCPPPDGTSTECRSTCDSLNCQDDLMIEGGTISISSVYSQGLLNSLTQALQSTGLDLSRATISVQIDLGKRADMPVTPGNRPVGAFQEVSSIEDMDQVQKKQKT